MDTKANAPRAAEECLPDGTFMQVRAVTAGPQEAATVKEPSAIQSWPTGNKDIRTVAIADLVVDKRIQQREAHLHEETVTEYGEALRAGEKLPRVIVFEDAGGILVLADGFHRIEACKKTGKAEVETEIRKGTHRSALLFAVGANSQHGLRRTQADKRKAILTLLKDPEWSTKSDRELGRMARVDHKTVGKIRKELEQRGTMADGEIPTPPEDEAAPTQSELNGVSTPDQPQQPEHRPDSPPPSSKARRTSNSIKALSSTRKTGSKRNSKSDSRSPREEAQQQAHPETRLSPDEVLERYEKDSILIKGLSDGHELKASDAFRFASRAVSILSYTAHLLRNKEQKSIREKLDKLISGERPTRTAPSTDPHAPAA